MNKWHPLSWQEKTDIQSIPYPCIEAVNAIVERLSTYPSLVSISKIQQLKTRIAHAINGNGFILQAGACAERFSYSTPQRVASKIALLNEL
jgi:3-deoxy-D-arabino-heptulosonate 7-phosphate (DAHP) synthase class II